MARPTYKPTAATRRKVAIAAGAGMAHDEIAMGLDISRNTLEKHFGQELSAGACEKRLEVLAAMFASAKKGNVAAQKAYVATPARLSPPPPEKPAKAAGKKEQANADAAGAQVGTEWGDLLPRGSAIQ